MRDTFIVLDTDTTSISLQWPRGEVSVWIMKKRGNGEYGRPGELERNTLFCPPVRSRYNLRLAQPRELLQYGLTMSLIDNCKAEITERRTIDLRGWLIVRTVVGELFSIVKPDADDERLEMLQAAAREVLEEDGGR